MADDPVLVQVLLVEDSVADIRLTQEVLRDARVINRLTVARDGIEALAMLRKQGRYAHALRPDLIFLDLNLPKKNGRDVLAEIKGDPDLKRIPVIVITSSSAEEDVIMSYDRHANCYITKPIELENFIRVVRAIEDFWVGIVKLPPR